MFTTSVLPILALTGTLLTLSSATPLESRQAYGLAGVGFNDTGHTLGNALNYWTKLPNCTWDLTRSDVMPVTSPVTIPFSGRRSSAIIEPSRSVLCIIDMGTLQAANGTDTIEVGDNAHEGRVECRVVRDPGHHEGRGAQAGDRSAVSQEQAE